jgi:hypothetical protein
MVQPESVEVVFIQSSNLQEVCLGFLVVLLIVLVCLRVVRLARVQRVLDAALLQCSVQQPSVARVVTGARRN